MGRKIFRIEHMNWRAELTPTGRKEIPEVPLRAITEAIVNSLCHRDYTNQKGNEIAFFKDRIEIYNPGQFPDEYTPEDFIKGKEKSILRNPLIATTLYLGKDIEKWGSGLKRIYEACNEENVKVEFYRLKSGFLVVFHRKEVYQKWPKAKGVEKGVEKLSENERIIYNLIKDNSYISKETMMLKGNLTKKTVEYNISKLKRDALIRRIGPDKGGHWKIIIDMN